MAKLVASSITVKNIGFSKALSYLSTFNFPKSGDFTRFTFRGSFAAFYLVPILATWGQVSTLAKEWAIIFQRIFLSDLVLRFTKIPVLIMRW